MKRSIDRGHLAVIAWMLGSALVGALLAIHHAWVPMTPGTGDCPRSPCLVFGRPFMWLAILVWIIGVLGSVIGEILTHLRAEETGPRDRSARPSTGALRDRAGH